MDLIELGKQYDTLKVYQVPVLKGPNVGFMAVLFWDEAMQRGIGCGKYRNDVEGHIVMNNLMNKAEEYFKNQRKEMEFPV